MSARFLSSQAPAARRAHAPGRVVLVGLAVGLLAVAGCGDDSEFATLTVELAALSSVATDTGENSCAAEREEALPSEVVCLAFELCRRTDEGCEPVGLVRTGGDHDAAGARVLRFPRSAVVSFDTEASGGAFELTVTGYDADGDVFASATARGFQVGAPVRVRLERRGVDPAWSCAPGSASGAALPRALHAATLLPNGEVLLYGGVFGSDIDPTISPSGTKGATLQPGIEAYDAVGQRLVPIRVGGAYEWRGRVLFASRLLPGPAAGPYTIALYGGYEASGRAVLFLDEAQSENAVGSPLVPAEDAAPGPALRLTYDPRARSVSISPLSLGNPDAVGTGFVAVSGDLEPGGPALLVLGAGAFTGGARTPAFAAPPRAFWVGPTGAVPTSLGASTLATARLGATATALGDANVFVWGGSVAEMDDRQARALAGELIAAGSPTRVIGGGTDLDCPVTLPDPVGDALPEPTAFHTATPIAPRAVLIAGGLLVNGEDCVGRGITTLYPTARPLSVVVFSDSGAPTATGVPLPAGYQASIFHSATATARGVVLVGGAGVVAGKRLEGLRQAGVVARDAGGVYTFNALPSLATGRWGHAATLLPGERLLVTGGFERFDDAMDARRVRAVSFAEVLPFGPRPAAALECVDEPLVVRDAGAGDAGRRDAGAADAAVADIDAGAPDAGP